MQRTDNITYKGNINPHIGELLPFLHGANMELKMNKPKGLKAKLSIYAPMLNTTASGQMSGVNIEETKLWSATVQFDEPRVIMRLFLRGSPTSGYEALAHARHRFVRPAGARMVRSNLESVIEGVRALKVALQKNPNGSMIIATVNHTADAAKFKLPLLESTVVVFGRPKISALMWGKKPEIGIELPVEMAILQSPLGVIYVAYNAVAALEKRFGVKAPAALPKTLANFARIAAGLDDFPTEPVGFDDERVEFLKGIVVRNSSSVTVERSYSKLITAIDGANEVKKAYAIEHDKSARRFGIKMTSANKVVVFGSPLIATRLMQRSFTAAMDLPMKMAVWNKDFKSNKVYVGYVAAEWIAKRHNASGNYSKLSGLLHKFSKIAVR